MKKPIFVKLTATFTFYGIGECFESAKYDALDQFNESLNEPNFMSDWGQEKYEQVEQKETHFEKDFVDFFMEDK